MVSPEIKKKISEANKRRIPRNRGKRSICLVHIEPKVIDKVAYFNKIRNTLKLSGDKFLGEVTENIVGYCMECKVIRPIKLAHGIEFKSKIKINRGNCAICGTEIYKTIKE